MLALQVKGGRQFFVTCYAALKVYRDAEPHHFAEEPTKDSYSSVAISAHETPGSETASKAVALAPNW